MARKALVSKESRKDKIIPVVKVVVGILGLGLFLGASVIIPATPVVVTPILKFLTKKSKEWDEIKNTKFDKVRLWVLLRRLEKQKDVKFLTLKDGSVEVSLTEKGRVKYIKLKLENLGEVFSTKNWDGKWRLIIFDVPEKNRASRNAFRKILSDLKFYQLQKSVYLTPYDCEREVEWLRRYYGLGTQVQVLVIEKLENSEAYRQYFGLT